MQVMEDPKSAQRVLKITVTGNCPSIAYFITGLTRGSLLNRRARPDWLNRLRCVQE